MIKRIFVFSVFLGVALILMTGCGSSNSASGGKPESTLEQRFNDAKISYEKEDWSDAIRMFEEIRIQAPTSPFASEASYLGAMARYKNGNFTSAAVDFRAFRRNYPTSPLAPRSQFMVAESYYQMSPRAELDQTYTNYAITEYQYFLRLFIDPEKSLTDSSQNRIVELRTKLALKLLYSAELYLKLEDRKSSLLYFERVLDQYYDTKPAIEAQLRIAEVQAARKKNKEAQDAISKFDAKYLDQATPEQRNRARSIKQS